MILQVHIVAFTVLLSTLTG